MIKGQINIELKYHFSYGNGNDQKLYIKNIPTYLDGAHNSDGARQLNKFLQEKNKNTWLIIGMLNNKNINLFLQSLKNNISGVIALKIPDQNNSFTEEEISNACKKINILCVEKKNIYLATKYLLDKINPDRIVITGSLYLIGKVRKLFI